MARATKARTVKARQEVEFRFSTVPFEPFRSLQTLDLEKLARARRAVVELGRYATGSCGRVARAVIKDGRVTAIEIDACPGATKKLAPRLARLLARGQAQLARGEGAGPRLPMPVARFFRRSSRGEVTIEITTHGGETCYMVCVQVAGILSCGFCCGKSSGDVTCIGIAGSG